MPATKSPTLAQWLAAVDEVLVETCGLTHRDLPDGNSYDAWADGVHPAEYAEELLAEEGFPFD